jgi:60S ribosome biogenesis protein Rrp14
MVQTRLKSHENAFQGLLSLIPSKLYYAEESQVLLPDRQCLIVAAMEKTKADRGREDFCKEG